MSTNKKSDTVVRQAMLLLSDSPTVSDRATVKTALDIMDQFGLGVLCVVDEPSTLKGIITEGDLRRLLSDQQKPLPALLVDDLMNYVTLEPVTIGSNAPVLVAAELMVNHGVWDLPVINDSGELEGLLHLHAVVESLIQNGK